MIDNISHYINLCGFELLQKKSYGWNFRCPICGDSKKSKSKKRGWIFWSSKYDTFLYYCHNCFLSMTFQNFINTYYKEVYAQYIKENFKSARKDRKETLTENVLYCPNEKYKFTYDRLDLHTIYSLTKDHIANQYFIKRKIPEKFFKYFYYTDRYFEWINTKIPNKFEKTDFDDPRIVIPFYTLDRKIFAVSGRSILENTNLRYITIKFDEDHPKVFGLERVKLDRQIYVFEGQFDSIFIPNSIACGGADVSFEYLNSISNKKNYVFCYDNDPRNKEICVKIEDVINNGYKVCLLPYELKKYGKDINKMIENGMTSKQIYDIINNNIFEGMKAYVKLKIWRKSK